MAGIETDKATVDYEMQEEGYIAKLLYPAGANGIPLGEVVAILVENKEDIAAFENWTPGASSASTEAVAEAPQETAASTPQTSTPAATRASGERIFVSPLAKSLAKESGIALDGIVGSGPAGRILKEDVLAAKSAPAKVAPAATPSTPAKKMEEPPAVSSALYTDFENSNIRKVIADRLTHSK